LLARAVERIGALPVKAGTGLTSEEQLELIKKHKSTVVFGRTGRIYQITQELLANGYDLGKLGVKTLFVTSEYLSESMRERLKSVWNCEVSFHYGLTEMGLGVAVECQAHNGFHLNEVDLLLEMIDPKTGEAATDGREAELVFSTLIREGMPLIRYRTHDISRLITGPCPCGAGSLLKFGKVTKRLESIVKISGGDEIYPAMFDELIFTIPDVIEYEVTLGREEGRDVLLFKAEIVGESEDIGEEMNRTLLSHPLVQANVQASRMALPRIELVPQGTLRRLTRAKKLIVDER
jgi:phenylacetate-CoA ligase